MTQAKTRALKERGFEIKTLAPTSKLAVSATAFAVK
jgi:hypothetical protein